MNPKIQDQARFEMALRRFDEENARDPNVVQHQGVSHPRELIYVQWLTDWVLKLAPDASEELRLAARCQHLCRWMISRESYPMTKVGYLQWRGELKKFHAEKSGQILQECGYPPEVVARVQSLNLKKGFPGDAETRVLEDALCLVFLEHQLDELAAKTAEDKVINALQKSWKKMTPAAHEFALKLTFSENGQRLVAAALAGA